ncbi:hypothetical protein SSBR45G_30350 [Bradyrhizobium sp. SSBR45G]|uniref:hypothetical protein n=1 Tax=unclassified Bradyrhizobium TaxID=2631580 RepID=UPI00234294B0|nr:MULTISPECIES: hypothetical protein [unclassified Bradyrhizobium]GLH78127.1 hypothetical protein SSBR45G_30350 [Bradyrhizobium sp. SSBR45G]GLH88025.1 hypothetical protein SSBR45R_54850 [Bradyrhizobium sp. SSBR45R]
MGEMFGRWLAAVQAYASADDPQSDIAAKVALVIVSNQPFYPLYLHAIAGTAAWPAWLTLLTTPMFASVPVLARRNPFAGRALMVVAGTAHTVFCVKLFGAPSGVELFLIPCALLGALLFGPAERLASLPLLGLPFLSYLLIDSRLGAPLMQVAETDYASLVAINATSVGALTALIGILAASRLSTQ